MSRSIDILLVEDRLEDISLIKEVLGAQKLCLRFFTVRNADEAIRFLRQQGVYELMPTPDLVLLDWKLPNFEDGERVLTEIRKDDKLPTLSIVLMSAYIQQEERQRVMSMGASYCVEKPLSFDKFIDIVNKTEDFWFTIIRRP